MKFRTEVNLPVSGVSLEIEDHVFSMGSCFATELSDLLKTGQIQTLNNPFGTVFNPFSINHAIKKLHHAELYTEEDLVQFNDEVISLDHHSSFNSRFLHQTLEKINTEIETGNRFLQETNWVIITYGTSFVYEFLPKKKL
ncbi:MAG: GSCFA domain-containing protein, partial [Kaistella sp.]